MWKEPERSATSQSIPWSRPEECAALVAHCIDHAAAEPTLVETHRQHLREAVAWRTVLELRNCLQLILGHGELICQIAGENAEIRRHADQVQMAVHRTAELASRLQTLGKTGSAVVDGLDLECGPSNSHTNASCGPLVCFRRSMPSLRGPFSLNLLNEAAAAGVPQGAAQ